MTVLVVDNKAQGANNEASVRFFLAVDRAVASKGEKPPRIAFDCEGINLSRFGSIELVSLCFESQSIEDGGDITFLIDLNEAGRMREKRVKALKELFECDTVIKVIHDSRMDCDALFHFFGITLTNVHDTSCFHRIITGMQDKNLNDVLSYNGIEQNDSRDKSVYKRNPAFWATRPLTAKMIEWASSDVDKLLAVAAKQVAELDDRGGIFKEKAKNTSAEYTTVVRDMHLERGLTCKIPVGLFVGRGGSNLRNLQRRTGTMIYRDHQPGGGSEKWVVYYSSASGLASVKRSMGYY